MTSVAARDWVHSFCRIVKLTVNLGWDDHTGVSLAQLCGLSLTLKSLELQHCSIPILEAIAFICSFPLLEDLRWCYSSTVAENDANERDAPSTSPKLTGSLRLIGCYLTRAMLNLPGGLHFILTLCPVGDARSTMDLVSRCSDTLESLCVGYDFSGVFFYSSRLSGPYRCPEPGVGGILPALDLSKAKKMKALEFHCTRPEI